MSGNLISLNRRRFLRLLGQGTAAFGMGFSLSGAVSCAKERPDIKEESANEKTEGKYQIFQPDEYFDWEKAMVEERFLLAQKEPQKSVGTAKVVKEEDLHKFNSQWDPFNPLFNNKEYAHKAGYQDIPAFPGFIDPSSSVSLNIPRDLADNYYYAHGPDERKYYTPIFAGDSLISESEKPIFKDITIPGTDLRRFAFWSPAKLYNQKGELVVWKRTRLRNAYKKIIDGSPKPSYSQMNSEWAHYLEPAHYTTDEEWEYIKELWKKEYIRGSQKLYWEDVSIGDEPAWTCHGPITHMDIIGWYGKGYVNMREQIIRGDSDLFRDHYGQYLAGGQLHFGSMNIPGHRAVFYNSTAARNVIRLVTNYIGDAGFVTGFGWSFQQLYNEMKEERVGGEYLDKVPYMKGKGCTVHGTEGDAVIGKGYVTDKYKNDKGEGIIDLVCWAETLDDRIIQVVPASAKLPLKKG